MIPCTLCWLRAMDEKYRTDFMANMPHAAPRVRLTYKDLVLGPAYYPNLELLSGMIPASPKPAVCPECGRKVKP